MIYIGHVSNTLSSSNGCTVVYCGRDFKGHKDVGLGNPTKIYQSGKKGWQKRYVDWLYEQYVKDPILYNLLNAMADKVRMGEDILLQCWCYKMVVPYQAKKLGEMYCHAECIAICIQRLVEKG